MKKSQCETILEHLESGQSIDGIGALNLCGCWALPQRIKELRDRGHMIVTQMGTSASGRKHATYWLAEFQPQTAQGEASEL